MKKLMIAAALACTMCVCAADAAPAAEPVAAKAVPEKVATPNANARQKMTAEQRKAFRERMIAARKARQADMLGKVSAVLKEAGLNDEQAKAAAEKIDKIYTDSRRGGRGMAPRSQAPGRRPHPRQAPVPAAAPAATPAPAAPAAK